MLLDQIQSREEIKLPDGLVEFMPAFLSSHVADQYLASFLGGTIDWRQEDVQVYGKRRPQPRLIAWYGDPNRIYTYSKLKLTSNPWTTELLAIRAEVDAAARSSFNSVLLNLYRSGQDSISWHSDDEPELGLEPVIASVSLGAVRRFRLRHKRQKHLFELALPHGSLLIMRAKTQQNWMHEIPKEHGVTAPRVNLTFRQIQ